MDSKSFKKIAKCFSLKDISIFDSFFYRNPGFLPPYRKNEDVKVIAQYRNWIESSQITDIDGELFAEFKYNVGFRVVDESEAEKEDAEHLAECATSYVVWYSLLKSVNQEELEAFGHYNVGYHVWPYWREHAHSITNKTGIGKLTIPMYEIPKFTIQEK